METNVIVATKEHFEDLVAMVAAFRGVLKRTTPFDADIRESLEQLRGQENREFFVAQDEAGNSLGYIEQRYEYSRGSPATRPAWRTSSCGRNTGEQA